MLSVKAEKINKIIDKNFNYDFETPQEGVYFFEIVAQAKSWWQNFKSFRALFRDDDIALYLDGTEISTSASKDIDVKAMWNGNELKGLAKTVLVVSYLKAGKHSLNFKPDKTPFLVSISIKELEEKDKNQIMYIPSNNNPPENGDRRPWISCVFVNLAVEEVSILAMADKKGSDDDDIKLIINGKIEKNEDRKSHRDWLWCGKILKGKEREIVKSLNFEKGVNFVELWADGRPEVKYLSVVLGENIVDVKVKEINDPTKIKDEFNPHYVIKDSSFTDNDSMTADQIQIFLDGYHDQKKKGHIAVMKFENRSAAYWIKKAADENLINPKLLLTKLQVEQRLIKGEKAIDPTGEQLDWAMGVGVLDNGERLKQFQSFPVQVNNAAKYFREYYNEAKTEGFIHKNVDGKPLAVLNAATYSLYKYTPHVEGSKLVYKVYKMFFGIEDLGGLVEKKAGLLDKIKLPLVFIILFLALSGGNIWAKSADKTVRSFKNSIHTSDAFEIISEVKIFSARVAQENDGLYCGFRSGKIFESSAKLSLFSEGRLVDLANLTDPELITDEDSANYQYYYLPHDVDGDDKKEEFITREYAGCNGDREKFIRLNNILGKFENIPIITKEGDRASFVYSGISENDLKFHDGVLEACFYNNAETGDKAVGFYKNYYIFDKKTGSFVWNKEEKQ